MSGLKLAFFFFLCYNLANFRGGVCMEEKDSFIIQMRNSGKFPIASLKVFDSIRKLDVSDYILSHHQSTVELYQEYLNSIYDLDSKKQYPFLKTVKLMEAIDNQALEKEDSFLICIYEQMDKESAIDYVLKRANPILDKKTFIEGHKVLLQGTKSEDLSNKDYRDDNTAYVGYLDQGKLVINYFPISYTEIDEAIDQMLEFYNSDRLDDLLFLKSQVIHGIIASLQMFSDGNTRYARILQNIKLAELTNKTMEQSLQSPALFGTRSYFPFQYDYRKLIWDLAKEPNNDHWDNWFKFNLNRAEDTMYFMDTKLEEFKKVKM